MTIEGIALKFELGEIKTQNLEQIIFTELCASDPAKVAEAGRAAARVRCEYLEKKTGTVLRSIKAGMVDNCSLAGEGTVLSGIESKIGAALVPMGFVGPAKIRGVYVAPEEELYIPLATNEAALIGGVQRGLKAIGLAGGLKTLVHFDGMARAPMIEAPDIYAAADFCRTAADNPGLIAELQTRIADPFVVLKEIETYQLGTKVILRLICTTGDAMGMNGVTKAAADITRHLLGKLPGWKLVTISSNLCTDKKSSHINVLHGRGKSVQTEIFIPEEVLTAVFKKGVTSRGVEKIVFNKCYLGSCFSGTVGGFNVNAANAVAAFYAATGQDLAQVISSSSAFVQAEALEGGLHFMVSLPCMELAAVGGGTMFGTAKEALNLIGCGQVGSGPDDNRSVLRLAEIAAAVVTALDLNTACAQAAGYEMADSHVKLARGEK
jgi:hydroxymethylglutaryl-CoA reductase (NADPH)